MINFETVCALLCLVGFRPSTGNHGADEASESLSGFRGQGLLLRKMRNAAKDTLEHEQKLPLQFEFSRPIRAIASDG